MIGIPLGLLYANASEWLIHKHLLHERGANKKSFWAFHWHDHHRACRRHDNYDEKYELSAWQESTRAKEVALLVAGGLITTPLLPIAPFFVGAVWYSAYEYYRVHKKSHLDPEWAKEHLPWHYDHHMGPNQHANWCVTKPWFDQLMGTREPYVGTERETRDIARREAKAARATKKRAEAEAAEQAAA